MNRCTAVSWFALFLLAGLSSQLAARDVAELIEARRTGEQEQIEARERWFRESRNLTTVAEASELRAQAAAEVRHAAATRAVSQLEWTSLGPESMTMLSWTMGPVAGRVAALAVHPADESTLFLGAASVGLWKLSLIHI